MTAAQAELLMATMVVQELQTSIGRIDLTPGGIPVVDDTDPTTIFDLDVSTVNDTSAADRDCLTFGIKMANDSGGNINGVTSNFIPAGSNSVVMMSNFWLLARVMRPRVASSLGRPVTDFDTPLRLNRSIPAPGGTGTLTNLEAFISGNRIQINGRATASGTGWSAVSNFTFFIDIALSGGAITVTATTPSVDTDVDLAWWVWLASLGLGALFGGVVGVIVAAIVLAIVESVAEGIANNLIATGIGGALAIPPIPLGPIGGGLTLDSVILDDLELRCAIVRSYSVPVKNSGTYRSSGAFTVDLDSGTVTPGTGTNPETDLIWNPSSGFSTRNSSGLTVTSASFGSLTPVEISRFPLGVHSISASMIPYSPSIPIPFFPTAEIVFGVRTSFGRYAKVKALRDLLNGGALYMQWVTYDTPVPELTISSHWSIVEKGDVNEYITPDCQFCRSYPVSRCGVFEAWPKLMAYPIDYQWCLCGKVLQQGEGKITTRDGDLYYKLEGRRLCIHTEMGQSIDCELCVSAIDRRGVELFRCVQISKSGIETVCKKCDPKAPGYRIDVIPAQFALSSWRPLITRTKAMPVAYLASGDDPNSEK